MPVLPYLSTDQALFYQFNTLHNNIFDFKSSIKISWFAISMIISYFETTEIMKRESEIMSNFDILVNELPDLMSHLFEGIDHVSELMKELPNTEYSLWVPDFEFIPTSFNNELPDTSCSLFLQPWDSHQCFTRFSELPREIRYMIWQYLLPPPRFIELDRIFYKCRGNRPRRFPIVDAFHANHESREEILWEMLTHYQMFLPFFVGDTTVVGPGGHFRHYSYCYGRDDFSMNPVHDVFAINYNNLSRPHAAIQFVQWKIECAAADPRVYDSFGKIKELHILQVDAALSLLTHHQVATDFMLAVSMFSCASRLVFHCTKEYMEEDLLNGRNRLKRLYRSIRYQLRHFRNIYLDRKVPEIVIKGPQGRLLAEPLYVFAQDSAW